MKLFTFSSVFVLFLLGGNSVTFSLQTADLAIKNAKIFSNDKNNNVARAVAIKGEFIIAVGSNEDIEKFFKPGRTRIIDANGRLLVPGFNDAHCHFGAIDPDYIDLRYVTDPNIITERVRKQVAKAKGGQLIRGGNWEHEMFLDKKWPSKELIDFVSPDNPVILSRADGHSVLVNSFVIKQSGVTKDTPNPPGGEIQKDTLTGQPTGIFKEKAVSLLKYNFDTAADDTKMDSNERLRRWQAALDMAARLGVTSIQVPDGDFEIFENLKKLNKLTCRISLGARFPTNNDEIKTCLKLQKKFPLSDNWIRFGYVKGYIDGTLGSGTALLFEPYSDEPEKTGLSMVDYEKFEKAVIEADKAGLQIGIHAIGDKGNNLVLNAYEKARRINGIRDSRHRIEHAQIIKEDDFSRFAQLGVIASMQPTHCITDKRFAQKRLGIERCKGAYAWQSLLKAGSHIAFGTDYSVEPLNPLEGLYASVTRKDRFGEQGEGWFPQQKLSMEKAIELYTLGSAYAEFTEDRKGIIKIGYLADIVIFRDDLLAISPQDIMKAAVDYTITGGKIVYTRGGAD